MRFLLKLFPTHWLWKEILHREGFSFAEQIEGTHVWSEVFHRVPLLKDWLKRRELILLKSVTLTEKNRDFILGQIAENRLYQRFDIPSASAIAEAPKVEPKIISRESFLSQWGTPNADVEKQEKEDSGVGGERTEEE